MSDLPDSAAPDPALDAFFARCRRQTAEYNARKRPPARQPGQPGFDPALVDVCVGEGPLPHSWENGNGNIHFDVGALNRELGLPDTQAERDDTAAMLGALLLQNENVVGVTHRLQAPQPIRQN